MSAHLTHRLPWASFCDVVKKLPLVGEQAPYNSMTAEDKKKIEHFARCLSDAIAEFKASDRSTDEARRVYDPNYWYNVTSNNRHFLLGYYMSLLMGYIELNLLVIDAKELGPHFLRDGSTYSFDFLLGNCDSSHPEPFSTHLRPAFDERGRLREITPEILQILRNHVAMLFRAMHSISGENELLDHEKVIEMVFQFFTKIDKR